MLSRANLFVDGNWFLVRFHFSFRLVLCCYDVSKQSLWCLHSHERKTCEQNKYFPYFKLLMGCPSLKRPNWNVSKIKRRENSRLSLMSTSSKSLISEICYDNNSNKFVRAYEIRIKYSTTQLVTVHIGIPTFLVKCSNPDFLLPVLDNLRWCRVVPISRSFVHFSLFHSIYVLNGIQGVSYRNIFMLSSFRVFVCVSPISNATNSYETFTK